MPDEKIDRARSQGDYHRRRKAWKCFRVNLKFSAERLVEAGDQTSRCACLTERATTHFMRPQGRGAAAPSSRPRSGAVGGLWAKVERFMEECDSVLSCESVLGDSMRMTFAHRQPLLLQPRGYSRERRALKVSNAVCRTLCRLAWAWGLALPFAVCVLSAPSAAAAAEAELPVEIALRWGESCDAQNGRLYVENTHRFRTAIVTVRWKAAGGKALEEKFMVEPGVIAEIGCALNDATIVQAELASF